MGKEGVLRSCWWARERVSGPEAACGSGGGALLVIGGGFIGEGGADRSTSRTVEHNTGATAGLWT